MFANAGNAFEVISAILFQLRGGSNEEAKRGPLGLSLATFGALEGDSFFGGP